RRRGGRLVRGRRGRRRLRRIRRRRRALFRLLLSLLLRLLLGLLLRLRRRLLRLLLLARDLRLLLAAARDEALQRLEVAVEDALVRGVLRRAQEVDEVPAERVVDEAGHPVLVGAVVLRLAPVQPVPERQRQAPLLRRLGQVDAPRAGSAHPLARL